jgi:hypothetical protein
VTIGESPADEPTEPIPVRQSTEPIQDDVAWEFYPAAALPAAPRRQAAGTGRVSFVLVGAMLLAIGVIVGYLLAFGARGHTVAHAPAASGHRPGGHRGASRTHSPTAKPRNDRAAHVLNPARISAFGPGGTGGGDSPQLARRALQGIPARPWHSSWYTTAHFGNLQSGTGLILKMKREVTITRVRIYLGYSPGASLELRIGNQPELSRLRLVARIRRAGRVARLHPRSGRGRYVLVWFTRLPPDRAGTFQASVYRIVLIGHR